MILSPKRESRHKEKGVVFLHQPSHVQLEDIPNHPQHIDLIYFCRALSSQAKIAPREAHALRWFSPKDLEEPIIRDEVRDTGKQAIEFVTKASLQAAG